MTISTVLPGISGLPLSQRPLLHSREPAHADRVIARLVDRLSFSTPPPATGTGMIVTGMALERLRVFGVRHMAPAAVRSAPLKSHHIVMPLQGRLRARSGTASRDIDPGTAVIYRAGSRLEAHWLGDCTALVLTVSGSEFARACARPAFPVLPAVTLPPEFSLMSGSGRSLASLLSCLCLECNSTAGSPTIVRGLQDLVLQALLELTDGSGEQRFVAQSTNRRRHGLRRALDYLDAHPDRQADIEMLARIACLSRRSLETAFVEHVGVGPATYIKRERLRKARAELLAGTQDSIALVASRWGFSDPGIFTRLYRREFGELPSASRARGQPGDH